MSRKSILTCALVLLAATAGANANAAEESSSEDSAPFAGSANKGPAPFAASPSAGFGAIGQWVLTMKTTGDNGYVFFHKPSGGDWTLSLHPSIDYFITNSVSLGATFGYFHSPAATGTTVVDLGARAGFNLNINDNLGFWPTAGISLNIDSRMHDDEHDEPCSACSRRSSTIWCRTCSSASARRSRRGCRAVAATRYGVDFVLGGWL